MKKTAINIAVAFVLISLLVLPSVPVRASSSTFFVNYSGTNPPGIPGLPDACPGNVCESITGTGIYDVTSASASGTGTYSNPYIGYSFNYQIIANDCSAQGCSPTQSALIGVITSLTGNSQICPFNSSQIPCAAVGDVVLVLTNTTPQSILMIVYPSSQTTPIFPGTPGITSHEWNYILSVTIGQTASTTTNLVSSTSSAIVGQPVTFTATVTPSPPSFGTPTGMVQFQINGANSGSPVLLSGGQASITTSSLQTGSNNIVALYLGDTGFAPSNSGTITVTLYTTSSVRGANLSGANLSGLNLSGANLLGTNLSGSNLQNTNLSGSNMKGANVSGGNLSGANLSSTNLQGSNLQNADLSGANLSGANLSGADLTGDNLQNANLSSANLHGAITTGANFAGAITTGCNGCP